MKRIFLILSALCLAISCLVAGSNKFSSKLDAYSKMKLLPILVTDTKSQIDKLAASGYQHHPYKLINGKLFVDMLLQLSNPVDVGHLKLYGCHIGTIVKDIATVRVPAEYLNELLVQDWIKKAEASRLYELNLDKSRLDIQADKVHQGFELNMPYQGEGVIVGVFDSGIDFTHPDFSDENGSRILYLWDMTDRATTKPPTEYGYDWGYVYTKSDIDNSSGNVLQRDPDANRGHGTHVTGTAAGSGKANPNMTGIAPKADIIFVKGTRTDEGRTFSENDIIAGCDFIFRKALELGKSAVVNLSLGTPFGSHDGSSLQEKALSNLTGPGKIIVASAGNTGALPIHSGSDVVPNVPYTTIILPFNICDVVPEFCPNIPNIFLTGADIWYDFGVIDSIGIGLMSKTFQILKEMTYPAGAFFQDMPFIYENDTVGYVTLTGSEFAEDGNGNIGWWLSNLGDTSVVINQYFWTLRIVAKKQGRVDMWAGVPLTGNSDMSIGSPASGKNIISVGSYVTKNEWTDIDGGEQSESSTIGDISDFSSKGPTRDGRMAPIISAPGQRIFAPLSSHLNEGIGYFRSVVLAGGKYQGMQGTSMSAPHVTGVIALMLQNNKNLSPEQIKKIFEVTARKDEFTGNEPNNTWGYGKLDALAAMKSVITSVAGSTGDNRIIIYPNPAENFIILSVGVHSSTALPVNSTNEGLTIEIYNTLGEKIKNIILNSTRTLSIDLSDCPSGAYFIRYPASDKSITSPFLISK